MSLWDILPCDIQNYILQTRLYNSILNIWYKKKLINTLIYNYEIFEPIVKKKLHKIDIKTLNLLGKTLWESWNKPTTYISFVEHKLEFIKNLHVKWDKIQMLNAKNIQIDEAINFTVKSDLYSLKRKRRNVKNLSFLNIDENLYKKSKALEISLWAKEVCFLTTRITPTCTCEYCMNFIKYRKNINEVWRSLWNSLY